MQHKPWSYCIRSDFRLSYIDHQKIDGFQRRRFLVHQLKSNVCSHHETCSSGAKVSTVILPQRRVNFEDVKLRCSFACQGLLHSPQLTGRHVTAGRLASVGQVHQTNSATGYLAHLVNHHKSFTFVQRFFVLHHLQSPLQFLSMNILYSCYADQPCCIS